MAVAGLKLHLKVAERETNGIVQNPHCKQPLRFSSGDVVSLSKTSLKESRQETKASKFLLFHLLKLRCALFVNP